MPRSCESTVSLSICSIYCIVSVPSAVHVHRHLLCHMYGCVVEHTKLTVEYTQVISSPYLTSIPSPLFASLMLLLPQIPFEVFWILQFILSRKPAVLLFEPTIDCDISALTIVFRCLFFPIHFPFCYSPFFRLSAFL